MVEKNANIALPEDLELKDYRCIKEVKAVKIVDIKQKERTVENNQWLVYLEGYDGYVVITDTQKEHYQPRLGGYLVLYENDYVSFSPGDVFEKGYISIKQ